MTAAERLNGLRVLVIEDETLLSMLLEDMLSELGCVIAGSASTVASALKAVDATAAGAAVLDLNLGGEKSDAVAEQLAARGVPFVVATGYGDDRVPDPWRNRPILQKPFGQEQLARALTRAIENQSRP